MRTSPSWSARLRRSARLIAAALFGLCVAASAAATEVRELVVKNERRTYRLYIPPDVRKLPVPVVIALHGAAQQAHEFEADFGMNRVAEREKFAVVYPVGLNTVWDDSRPAAVRLEFMFKPGDDVAFLTALVRRLVGDGIADPARVYLAGLSMGGFMTARMACERSQLFAAIAMLAATVPKNYYTNCRPTHAMPVMLIHGKFDTINPWYGVPMPGLELLSAPDTARFFAELNRCMAATEAETPTRNWFGQAEVTLQRWSLCQGNAAVVLVTLTAGGHLPPSRQPGRGESFVSYLLPERSHVIDAAAEVWAFFRQYRRDVARPAVGGTFELRR